VCPGAEKSNVKIEEERPDVKLESEHKNADSGSIIQHPNNKYPFIWLPSGNIKGKENGEHYELSPQILNEWAPVKQQEQDNQKGKQFQWPIVWMPAGMRQTKRLKLKRLMTQKRPQNPQIFLKRLLNHPRSRSFPCLGLRMVIIMIRNRLPEMALLETTTTDQQ
jgi:hypothetical protein